MEDRAVEMRRAVVRKDFPLIVEVTILHSTFSSKIKTKPLTYTPSIPHIWHFSPWVTLLAHFIGPRYTRGPTYGSSGL